MGSKAGKCLKDILQRGESAFQRTLFRHLRSPRGGRENIPKEGAIIVAPNHKSNFDPPIVGVAFKDRIIHYMAKEELFKNPIFGYILRQFGTFPVKRGSIDRMAIRRAILELKEGNALGIFPEGTRIQRKDSAVFIQAWRPLPS